MAKALFPDYAMNDPALALLAAFRPLRKGGPGSRPKLDIKQTFNETTLHWRGPDVLSIPEQTLWLTLVALAGIERAKLSATTVGCFGTKLNERLQVTGWSCGDDAALIRCTWSELARACGMLWTDKRSIAQVREGLKRLAEVTVWRERAGMEMASRLLAWLVGDDKQVQIALNWRIAAILFNGAQFARVSLEERRALQTDTAKALHAWVSASLREGRKARFGLATLASRIWGDFAVDAKARDRRRRLRAAITELNTLSGWSASESDGLVSITRVPRENTHALREITHVSREITHAPPPATRCRNGQNSDSGASVLEGTTNRLQGRTAGHGGRRLAAPPGLEPRSPHVGGDRQDSIR